MTRYLLLFLLFLVVPSCGPGTAVTALEASPLANYSLVPSAGADAVGEIDLFGVGVASPTDLAIALGRKADKAILYRRSLSLSACEGLVLRAADRDVELVHLRGADVLQRFPFLSCHDDARAAGVSSLVLWRGR